MGTRGPEPGHVQDAKSEGERAEPKTDALRLRASTQVLAPLVAAGSSSWWPCGTPGRHKLLTEHKAAWTLIWRGKNGRAEMTSLYIPPPANDNERRAEAPTRQELWGRVFLRKAGCSAGADAIEWRKGAGRLEHAVCDQGRGPEVSQAVSQRPPYGFDLSPSLLYVST